VIPAASYILPLATSHPVANGEFDTYLAWLSTQVEVVVVDGSPTPVFAAHHARWADKVRHLSPDPDLATPMGKVGGVLTGVRRASHDRLVIADDDVRYDEDSIQRILHLLDQADIVRPQNFFRPLPWHARWDTARSLLNRLSGGDWPGTLGLRRARLLACGGYAGDVMFENLELTRTVKASGGHEIVALDLFVHRLPPTARHFLAQRVRQAYDELARPWRLAAFLSVVPGTAIALAARRPRSLLAVSVCLVGAAELGRRRAGGQTVFPASASLFAPLWVAERGVCSWLALGARVRGGVRYRDTRLRRAATPSSRLRRSGIAALE
jgi:hypothetical protein